MNVIQFGKIFLRSKTGLCGRHNWPLTPEVGGPLKPQSMDSLGKGFSHRAPQRPLEEKAEFTQCLRFDPKVNKHLVLMLHSTPYIPFDVNKNAQEKE